MVVVNKDGMFTMYQLCALQVSSFAGGSQIMNEQQ